MLPVKKWSEKPILKDAGTRPNHSKMDTGSVVYAMDQCHLGCFYGWSAFLQPGRVGALRLCTNFIIIIIVFVKACSVVGAILQLFVAR